MEKCYATKLFVDGAGLTDLVGTGEEEGGEGGRPEVTAVWLPPSEGRRTVWWQIPGFRALGLF